MARDTNYENYEHKITRLEKMNTILSDVTELGAVAKGWGDRQERNTLAQDKGRRRL